MTHTTDYRERYSAGWSKDSVRLFHVASAFAKSTYFYVQECGYFQTDDTYFTERENLNSYLLVYTLSGSGILHYQGREFSLEKGDCFYINCMEKHLYFTRPKHSWELLWIHFNGPVALGFYEKFAENGFQTIQSMTNNATHLLLPEPIKQVIIDIKHNFKSDLSLQSLASRHNISKFHLSKEFKKYTGCTAMEYIIANRLAYAKELLKYSDLSVSEITERIGMHNISHFIHLFKAREGMTPPGLSPPVEMRLIPPVCRYRFYPLPAQTAAGFPRPFPPAASA